MHAHTEAGLKAGGMWLAIGALVFTVGLVLHPMEETMDAVADAATIWRASHWFIAAGSLLLVAGAWCVLAAGSRLSSTWVRMTAWTAFAASLLVFIAVPLIEATVATDAAVAGDTATWDSWNSLATGVVNVMFVFSASVIVLAWIDMKSSNWITPKWASTLGMVGAFGGMLSMALPWFGVTTLGWLFFGVIVAMLWVAWFGVGVMRPAGMHKLEPMHATA